MNVISALRTSWYTNLEIGPDNEVAMRSAYSSVKEISSKWTMSFHVWMLRSHVCGGYKSILLADMTVKRQRTAEFAAFTLDALRLIERTDPRRFRYLQREVRYVVNVPLLSGAAYKRETRRCSIDFQRYAIRLEMPEREWYLAAYASAIVHEATHGRIHHFGIAYNETTWERIERLCRTEERRFANRLQGEYYDFSTLVPDFDLTWHRQHRARTRFQYMKQVMARSRELEAQSRPKKEFFLKRGRQ